jgi:hypothetical protein
VHRHLNLIPEQGQVLYHLRLVIWSPICASRRNEAAYTSTPHSKGLREQGSPQPKVQRLPCRQQSIPTTRILMSTSK